MMPHPATRSNPQIRDGPSSRYALVGSGTHASCRYAAMSELGAETPNHVPQPKRWPMLTLR
jgi:hypothetical protein